MIWADYERQLNYHNDLLQNEFKVILVCITFCCFKSLNKEYISFKITDTFYMKLKINVSWNTEQSQS